LAAVLAVAEAALESAKEHAAGQRSAAMWNLGTQLGFVALALLLAAGSMMTLTRRVIRPQPRTPNRIFFVIASPVASTTAARQRCYCASPSHS